MLSTKMSKLFTVQQKLAELKRKHAEYQLELYTLHGEIEGENATVCSYSTVDDEEVSDPCRPPLDCVFELMDSQVQNTNIHHAPFKESEKPVNGSSGVDRTVKKPFLRKGQGKLAFSQKSRLKNTVTPQENAASVAEKFKLTDRAIVNKTDPFNRAASTKNCTGIPYFKNANRVTFTQLSSVLNSECPGTEPSGEAASCSSSDIDDECDIHDSEENKVMKNVIAYLPEKIQVTSDRNVNYPGCEDNIDDNTPCWAINNSIALSFLDKIKDEELRSKNEANEIKVFELLEERVENASFCSTSSLVAKLMEPSVKSTPKKYYSQESCLSKCKEESDEETGNLVPWKKLFSSVYDKIEDDSIIVYHADNVNQTCIDMHQQIGKDVSFDSPSVNGSDNRNFHGKFGDDISWNEFEHDVLANVLPPAERLSSKHDLQNTSGEKVDGGISLSKFNSPNGFADEEADLHNKQIRNSVSELSGHIILLKKELKELISKKDNYMSEIKIFEKEKKKIRKKMEEERNEFELYKEQVKKNLQREKATLERYSKSLRDQPKYNQLAAENKLLKQELSALREDINSTKKSYGSLASSLRNQVHALLKKVRDLSEKNESLSEEVKFLKNLGKNKTKESSALVKKKNSQLNLINDEIDAACSLAELQLFQTRLKSKLADTSEICIDVKNTVPQQRSESSRQIMKVNFCENRTVDSERSRVMSPKSDNQVENDPNLLCCNRFIRPVPLLENFPIQHSFSLEFGKTFEENDVETVLCSDGREVCTFPTGEVVHKHPNEARVAFLPDDSIEIVSGKLGGLYFRDGSFKTLQPDGSVETIYHNGRIRIRNSNKSLIFDGYE